MATNRLQVTDLCVSLKKRVVLKNINLTACPGQILGIIGPNGAGKSTLLKAMVGLIPCDGGTINYRDKKLEKQLHKIAYIPQRSKVDWDYPTTVKEVVMTGRIYKTGMLRKFSKESQQLVLIALKRLGMSNFQKCPIGQLSGGQQQRVFLARALAQEADIFCLDEPLTGVDFKTQRIIFEFLKELKQKGKIIIMIHHDFKDIIEYFDHVILLNKQVIRQGKSLEILDEENMTKVYGG
jgi:manganese/iron transport system ATP-binding protein